MVDVLVVDDRLVDVALTLRALRLDARVTSAVAVHDSKQLAQYLAGGLSHAQPIEPDVVLLELEMQDEGGMEALGVIRCLRDIVSLPVVIFSVFMDEHRCAEALKNGAMACVRKPDDALAYSAVIEHILDSLFRKDGNEDGETPCQGMQATTAGCH